MGQLESALETSPPDYGKVSQLKRSLEVKIDTLKALDADILDYMDDETELAEEIEQADEFMGVVYAAVIKAERSTSSVPGSTMSASSSTSSSGSSGCTPAAKMPRVKLPELSLNPFSGDVTQWLTFWDLFKSAVHDNDQLTGVDKFNYLKSLLTGTAQEAIAGVMHVCPRLKHCCLTMNLL